MVFSKNTVPLSAAIFIAEPQQQRISTTIGAKSNDLASLEITSKKLLFLIYTTCKFFKTLKVLIHNHNFRNTYKVKKKTLQEIIEEIDVTIHDLQGFQQLYKS